MKNNKTNQDVNDKLVDGDRSTAKSLEKSQRRSKKKPVKKSNKSKSGDSLASASDFEQFYAAIICNKINHFAQQHHNKNIANVSMEILFVDIYSALEKEGMADNEKFVSYSKPQMVEKTREVKIRNEKAGFLSKLLGWPPKIDTQIIQERYMDEGPSEFKEDIKNSIIFYYFARVEHDDFTMGDIIKYIISLSFEKIGYSEYSNDIRADMLAEKLELLDKLQVDFIQNKEKIEQDYSAILVDSHDTEAPKI